MKSQKEPRKRKISSRPSRGKGEQENQARLAERLLLLGIPAAEMTDSVTLAASALLEKLDDMTRDLSEAREQIHELERLVEIDHVTGAPNRRAFMRRLEWALSMRERYGHPCSILYFDLNGFKAINDTYGHAAGDAAIAHMAHTLLASLRDSDFLARLGGDEFAILLYHATYDAALARGTQLAERVGVTPLVWEGRSIALSTAFGTHEIRDGERADYALSHADMSMYVDKRRIKALS